MTLISIVLPIIKIDDLTFPVLDSLIQQKTNINYEIVIIIDSNNSIIGKKITESYSDYIKSKKILIIENKKNLGLTKSLNIAINNCHGKFVLRNDQDDISSPYRIYEYMKVLNKYPNVKFIYSNFHSKKRLLIKRRVNSFGLSINKILKYKNPISHSSSFYEKELFNKLGGYDERLKTSQDFDLWYKFIASGFDHYHIRKSLVTINYSRNSISGISGKHQRIYSVIICLRNTFGFELNDNMIIEPISYINKLLQATNKKEIRNKLISLVFCYLYDEDKLIKFNLNIVAIILIIINYYLHPNLLIKRIKFKLFRYD